MALNLNTGQREAILDTSRSLLIVAGPGTGKTFTLVRKIEHLLKSGADPSRLTAITFTTKAAEEMRDRLIGLCGNNPAPFIGTFHALGLRLLRRHGAVLGLPRDLKVFGEEERGQVLAKASESAGLGLGKKELGEALRLISLAKNQDIDAESLPLPDSWSPGLFQQLFEDYEAGLRSHAALDFDDLVKKASDLLEGAPDLRQSIRDQQAHLFVDEYQDINEMQYRFLFQLTGDHSRICAIGDPDQAIYAFRGSDPGHFLRFSEDFPGGRTVVLKRNYRSTQTVIELASTLIRNNRERMDKELISEAAPGPRARVFQAADPWKEAAWITGEIERLIGGTDRMYQDRATSKAIYDDPDGYHFSDFAVLYRTKAQSRILESAFRKCGIPFQTVAGTPWYRCEEIRVPLAYLQLLLAPDPILLAEILDKPQRGLEPETIRGIGGMTLEAGAAFWRDLLGSSYLAEMEPSQVRPLRDLAAELQELTRQMEILPPAELLQLVLDRLGLLDFYRDGGAKGEKRYQNILQLSASAAQFDAAPGRAGLEPFLHYYQLLGEHESYDGKRAAVTLMTLHASKGLEFPVVFITGLEQGLLPYAKKEESDQTEEERRLFYVGVTRAQTALYLTHAAQRDKKPSTPSAFLAELPQHLLDPVSTPKKRRMKKGNDAQLSLF